VLMICRVTGTYMFPYKEDLFRFDFEVDGEDEHLCRRMEDGLARAMMTPPSEQEGGDLKRVEQH
jgi:hypothetical protein